MARPDGAASGVVRWHAYVTINVYYLGLSTTAQTLTPLLAPLLVQQFVGEARKATFYGALRLWGLMAALLAQATLGMLTDRCTLRWGRRRPFILAGTLASLVCLAAIGLAAGMQGMPGYWFLFALYVALQISSNAAQSAQQGLIPDLAPEPLRGRFSAVKALFEVPLPAILVSVVIARLLVAGRMWASLAVVMGVLASSMALTMLAREEPLQALPPLWDWRPVLRLAGMTAAFTLVILGMGEAVKAASQLAGNIVSTSAAALVVGATGLIAMSLAVALGVWISVRISLGAAARDNSCFTWWIVNRLAFLAGAFNLSGFTVYFMQERLGLRGEQAAGPAALAMLLVVAALAIFALLGGWLADLVGRKKLVAISGLAAALGALVLVSAPDLAAVYVGACLVGAATGLFYTANWAMGVGLIPAPQAARYLGVANLAGAGAGAVGAYIGGPIADYFTARASGYPGLGYVVLFAIYGALFLLSVAALARVREPVRPIA